MEKWGRCVKLSGGYRCDCAQGFKGKDCDQCKIEAALDLVNFYCLNFAEQCDTCVFPPSWRKN